jgi:hypothetical protein
MGHFRSLLVLGRNNLDPPRSEHGQEVAIVYEYIEIEEAAHARVLPRSLSR